MEAMSDNNTGDNNTDASAASHAASHAANNGDLVRIGEGDYLYWEDLQPSTFDLGEYT